MSMKLNNQLYLIILFLSFVLNLEAQESEPLGPLITDRPDATESPTAVPKGFLQVADGDRDHECLGTMFLGGLVARFRVRGIL